jgi:tetratricopeptide (TPR) repeat protein
MKSCLVFYRIKFLVLLISFSSFGFAQQTPELKLAERFLRSHEYENALNIFQKYYSNGNFDHTIINGISSCLAELGRTEELIIFLRNVTKKVPEVFSYSIELGRAYFLNDQPDSAMKVWKNVYSVEPPHLMRHRMVAQTMTSLRLFDEAIDVYLRALKLIPDQDAIQLDIATLYKAQLNYEKASEHYLKYYQKFKKQQNYVRSLLINMANDEEAADRIIVAILNFNDNNDPDLNEILANLYMRKKDYKKAFEIIKEIQSSLNDGGNLTYIQRFANEAAKDKSYEYVIKAYEYALDKVDQRLTTPVKLNLAEAYYNFALELFEKSNKDKADTEINKSLTILKELQKTNSQEKYSAYELCADIYKNQFNDLDQALENYNQINLSKISSVDVDQVRLKIADTHFLKNNLLDAEKLYKQVKSKKFYSLAQFKLAELKYFKAEFTESKNIYNLLISQIGMSDSLANNAMERKFQIDQFLGDSINFAKFSEASMLKNQKKYSEAAKKFRELYFGKNITSFSAGMESVLLYNRINKIDESNQILEDIIQSYPGEDNTDYAYFLLANNYKLEKKLENALTTYQELLFRFPTSFYTEQARENARQINTLLQNKINN